MIQMIRVSLCRFVSSCALHLCRICAAHGATCDWRPKRPDITTTSTASIFSFFHFRLRKGLFPCRTLACVELEILKIRKPLCIGPDNLTRKRRRRDPLFLGRLNWWSRTRQPAWTTLQNCLAKVLAIAVQTGPGYSLWRDVRKRPCSSVPMATVVGLAAPSRALSYRSLGKNGVAHVRSPVGLTASAPQRYCATWCKCKPGSCKSNWTIGLDQILGLVTSNGRAGCSAT